MPGRNAGESLSYDVFETPLGWVAVAGSERGVRKTSLPESSPDAALAAISPESGFAVHSPASLTHVRRAIIRYCSGQGEDLTYLPIDDSGASPFFARAWAACRLVPAGETRTYAWLAAASGNPRAARGAGQAMARNPFPLLVPCHRIVGSDGGLHGFGGSVGLPMKQRLLDLEKRQPVLA
jgi:methylated-DNA-[protein]-cysteine S-methyltransferase